MNRKKVLVIGGTGYLGQHVLQGLTEINETHCDFAFTFHSNVPQKLLEAVSSTAFLVDLKTGQGFETITDAFGQPHVVINCAALSIPRACEIDPETAMAINVPSSLVKWLSSFHDHDTLLIHLSTDQVYEGLGSFYSEDDKTIPVNMYGKSKVAAEQFISATCKNYAILRSSIIYGQQTISPVTKSLPIQEKNMLMTQRQMLHAQNLRFPNPERLPKWIDTVLSHGKEVEFFEDEFRCPIYVKDIVNIILFLVKKWLAGCEQMQLVLNAGGSDRVSRVQMAETVATIRGYSTTLIKPVPAASVNRGVTSPADISMDISKLVKEVGFSPVSFKDGVKLTLHSNCI